MQIDLNNFFLHFDPKNAKHVAAVAQLAKDLSTKAPDLLEDAANWVRIYRTPWPPVTQGEDKVLDVPWFPQTDNYTDPNGTCNSSACAMALEYFKPGTLQGERGDDDYLEKVLEIGASTNHVVQTQALNSYGLKSEFRYNLGFDDLDKELAAGRPVVIGILHRGTLSAPTGGHVLVVIGKKGNDYIVNDPYGTLNDGYTSEVSNGKGAVYKRSELQYRWLDDNKDNTGWGRIFFSEQVNEAVQEAPTKNEIPQSGVELIKKFEGFRADAYYDPLTKNLPITIGYGSTKKLDGSPFFIGDKITQDGAELLLIKKIEEEYLPPLVKISGWNEMNDEMRGALLSFAYNLGANFYGSSEFKTITETLREKRWNDVPKALELYRNPGTPVEQGLLNRRRAEGQVWLSGLSKL